jgi:periplasmic divalent cation tolerance protein
VADCVQVTTTWPDERAAQSMAARVVEERLAACAQVVGPVSSTYRWKGEVERTEEWYCHLKTTRNRLPTLEARILELHPNEVPEIIAVPILTGNPAYLRWIEESVTPGSPTESTPHATDR